MEKVDLMKNFRQVKFTSDHTLTSEQLHQLIREKLERAERQHLAMKAHRAGLDKQKVEDFA